ncbi:hypothetical protein XENOCAPTIV_002422 [Xenoophorus captivus]|uniref:Signal-induced proliferation-associated 1-like protein C-terminal domain-containing protein n=1 Tax=Xenoophorus captivus TaxID=1517983 RepID=A0ABV0Q8G0_9TELE
MGQGCSASSPQNEAAAADLSPTSQDALSPGTKSFYPRQGATSKYLIGWKKPGGTMNSVDTQERWRPEGFNLPFLVLSPGDLTAPESSELEQERKQQLQDSKDAKASLQVQIQSLREDNQRLLEESYSASAKLKKFTEWVFNTIDMN